MEGVGRGGIPREMCQVRKLVCDIKVQDIPSWQYSWHFKFPTELHNDSQWLPASILLAWTEKLWDQWLILKVELIKKISGAVVNVMCAFRLGEYTDFAILDLNPLSQVTYLLELLCLQTKQVVKSFLDP